MISSRNHVLTCGYAHQQILSIYFLFCNILPIILVASSTIVQLIAFCDASSPTEPQQKLHLNNIFSKTTLIGYPHFQSYETDCTSLMILNSSSKMEFLGIVSYTAFAVEVRRSFSVFFGSGLDIFIGFWQLVIINWMRK